MMGSGRTNRPTKRGRHEPTILHSARPLCRPRLSILCQQCPLRIRHLRLHPTTRLRVSANFGKDVREPYLPAQKSWGRAGYREGGGVKLWRIEAGDGRRPFRPGFSQRWRSRLGRDFPPPWTEVGMSLAEFQSLFSDGFQGGCACRSKSELHHWFNFAERRRLAKFGFRTVVFEPDRILLETPSQVVFERRMSVQEAA